MSEPFPLLNTASDQLHNAGAIPRQRRRQSSVLGGDLRAGDTGAPAMATSRASMGMTEGQFSSDSSVSASSQGSSKRLSRRRRARGLASRIRQTMIKHTFVLPAFILVLFGAGYALNPTESNILHRFIFLAYPLPQDDPSQPRHYGKGRWDAAFVLFYTIVLSFTRELIMQELLRPLAKAYKLPKVKQARFMEQLYTAIYFGVLGPVGLYVMSKTPVWYFNTAGMYEGFPHKTHEGCVKFYYLFQAAYWLQQAIVLVLGMEKPRKDFKELVGHHIVTLGLIGLSYRFHFTYIGIAVYITHDISDFFLAMSKTFNYIDHPITAPWYALFMVVWIYMRHYINLRIIWSLFTEFQTIGPFELNWATEQYKCTLSQVITASLLSTLQALNLFWLFYIVRVAYRIVALNVTEDDRSEDEGGEDDDEVVVEKAAAATAAAAESLKSNGKSAKAKSQ